MDAERAERAFRIRTSSPNEWKEFATVWMAFNVLYDGETSGREVDRVMECIRKRFDDNAAKSVLQSTAGAIEEMTQIPPGDMRWSQSDPKFRAESDRFVAYIRNASEPPVERLAAVGGILYQIRCNLIHGSKSPDDSRDSMLVQKSMLVLQSIVPVLEQQMKKGAYRISRTMPAPAQIPT